MKIFWTKFIHQQWISQMKDFKLQKETQKKDLKYNMLCVNKRAWRERQRLGQPENYKGSIKKRKNGKYIWDDKETGRQLERKEFEAKHGNHHLSLSQLSLKCQFRLSVPDLQYIFIWDFGSSH